MPVQLGVAPQRRVGFFGEVALPRFFGVFGSVPGFAEGGVGGGWGWVVGHSGGAGWEGFRLWCVGLSWGCDSRKKLWMWLNGAMATFLGNAKSSSIAHAIIKAYCKELCDLLAKYGCTMLYSSTLGTKPVFVLG